MYVPTMLKLCIEDTMGLSNGIDNNLHYNNEIMFVVTR